MNDLVVDFQNSIMDNISKTVNNRNMYYNHVTKTIIFISVCLISFLIINRLVEKSNIHPTKKKRIRRIVKNTLIAICLVAVSIIWINALNSLVILLILLGMFAVVLIRNTLDNLIGWYFIRKRNYFKVDQRIEIGEKIGKVISSNFFYFELAEIKNWLSSETQTGRIIKIPNKEILDTEVFNYSEGNQLVRQEINFLIRHDNDFKAAKEIILSAINTHYEKNINPIINQLAYKQLDSNLEPAVYLDIQEGGLFVSCQFLVDFHEVAKTKSSLYEIILEEFNVHQAIEFAVIEIKKVD